jgi:putative aldouronate transport system permease protein
MVVKKVTLFDIVNYTMLVILSFIFLYPIFITFSISFSDPDILMHDNVAFLPKGFVLDAYKVLLSDGRILRYYFNTIKYAFFGTIIMILCTSMMAYPLTFKNLKGKKFVTILLTITMFFGGGLVPYYLIIRNLGMIDTIWVMILPGAISAWNVIIFKTFFLGIPIELSESAFMDGASYFRVLFGIIVPLSKPLIATFVLFSVVGYWNDYLTPLMFLRSDGNNTIQIMLRRILVIMEYKDIQNYDLLTVYRNVSTRTVKSAAVVITITPILCIYPFLQKYFAKGILIGSIKA